MRFNIKAIALLLVFIPSLCSAKAGYFEPWGKDCDLQHKKVEATSPRAEPSIPVKIADKIIQFHQKVISPVDGPRSHFRPTSSRYMQISMQRYGFINGFIMGCDRLLRENKDPWVYRVVEIEGQLFKFDPP